MEPIRGPFLLLFLTVTAVLILGCQASDSGIRDTSKPSPAKVLQATKSNPTPTRTLQPTDLPSTTAVQYGADGDRRNAVTVSKAFDWPLIHVCSDAELSTYANWVLVGGQYANPIYKLVFGDGLSESDEGHIVIKRDGSCQSGGKDRVVWGIAGWSATDTLEAAAYVIEKGLPEQEVRIRR